MLKFTDMEVRGLANGNQKAGIEIRKLTDIETRCKAENIEAD